MSLDINDFKYDLEYIHIDELHDYEHNAKLHPPQQILAIAHSLLNTKGTVQPIFINKDNRIIAGHGLRAGIKLALTGVMVEGELKKIDIPNKLVPCVRVDLPEVDEKALILAFNRVADDSEVKIDTLRQEIDYFIQQGIDITPSGYDSDHIDELLSSAIEPESPEPSANESIGGELDDQVKPMRFKIGLYTFLVPQEVYGPWITKIKEECDDDADIKYFLAQKLSLEMI